MAGIAAGALLTTWEQGLNLHPVDRALALLALASPAASRNQLAMLSVGQRDAGLLALRQAAFGAELNGLAECPRCHEALEFSLSTNDLQAGVHTLSDDQAFKADGYAIRFRPLNSLDLAAIAACADSDDARLMLAQRCIVDASRDEVAVAPDDLPSNVTDELSLRLAACDPMAEVLLDFTCPGCEEGWQSVLDIASFLWSEVASEARRLLQEVHALARAYGWREADILSMSAARRRLYLEMVG